MRRRFVLAAAALAMAGCGSDATEPAVGAATRTATKTTCAEAILDTELTPLDRKLVPYGPTLLGVETSFGSEEQIVYVISGGYLDDVLEAYDDMVETGETTIRGSSAVLLSSSLLGEPVRAAVWREDLPPPCDTHAVIATGLTDEEFARELSLLR